MLRFLRALRQALRRVRRPRIGSLADVRGPVSLGVHMAAATPVRRRARR
jgi:hypothetical protein